MSSEIERDLNRRLAREVEKHMCLYNNTIKYGAKERKKAWLAVAEALNYPELNDSECEKRWQSVVRKFSKNIKEGQFPYNFLEMNFLTPFLKSNETFELPVPFASTPLNSSALNLGSIQSLAESDVSMTTVSRSDVTMRTASEAGELETDTSTIQDDNLQTEAIRPPERVENASRESSNMGFDQSPAAEYTIDERNHDDSSSRSSRSGTSSKSRKRRLENMTGDHASQDEWMDTFNDSMRPHLLDMNSRQQLSYKSKVTSIVEKILGDNDGSAN